MSDHISQNGDSEGLQISNYDYNLNEQNLNIQQNQSNSQNYPVIDKTEIINKLKKNLMNKQNNLICFDSQMVINQDPNDSQVYEDYQCQICLQEIANNPIQCPQCHKIYGFNCANTLFEQDIERPPTCPQCKKIWTQPIEELKNRWIKENISKQFKLKCINFEQGCNVTLKCSQEEIQNHEIKCDYEKMFCENQEKGCQWYDLRLNYQVHIQQECNYVLIQCQHCAQVPNKKFLFLKNEIQTHVKNCDSIKEKCQICKQMIFSLQKEEHLNNECPKKVYECKSCYKKFFRKEYQNHLLKVNCYKPKQEKQMFDKIQDQFQIFQQQLDDLQKVIQQQSEQIQEQNLIIKQQKNSQQIFIEFLDIYQYSMSKKQLIKDFWQGIFHVNCLDMVQQLIDNNIEIKSIFINETDVGKYKKSLHSPKDYSQAIQKIKDLADSGDQWSQFSLGFLYFYGDKHITQNYEQVFKLSNQLIAQNNPGGMWILAKLFQLGDYVEKDEEMAFSLYQRCNEQNFPPGINMLGFCYCNGIGTDKDEEKGMQLYQKNEKYGYFTSLFNLGCIYFNEDIVPKNENLGFKYFLMAAQRGCYNAMTEVANCYLEADGIEKNIAQSQFWKKKATEFEEYHM